MNGIAPDTIKTSINRNAWETPEAERKLLQLIPYGTSLSERIGGERNWDYRCCWVRDATFTLLFLMHAGYFDEAKVWRDWLLRAVPTMRLRPQSDRFAVVESGFRRDASCHARNEEYGKAAVPVPESENQ